MNQKGYINVGRAKVIEHKRRGSTEIMVVPIEVQPYQKGDLISDIVTIEAQGTDAQGNQYQSKADTSKSIMATWLSRDANRVTAPDVRRDDIVELYTYYDTQKYFWAEAENNNGRRRMEQVTHRYSSTEDEAVTELDDDNSIKVDVNGELGTYTITLPKIGKSKASAAFQIDTHNGNIIWNMGENFIQVNEESRVELSNKDGCYATFDKGELTMVGPDTIVHETKKYNITSTSYTLDNEGIAKVTTNELNYVAAGKVNITGATATIGGASTTVITGSTVTVGPAGVMSASAGGVNFGGPAATISSQVTTIESGAVVLSPGAAQTIANQIKPYL